MAGTSRKKLYLYVQSTDATLEDSIDLHILSAKDWEDFTIIRVNNSNNQALSEISSILESHLKDREKKVVVVDASLDLEFYGVETDDD